MKILIQTIILTMKMSNRALSNIIEATIFISALWYWIVGELPSGGILIGIGFVIYYGFEILKSIAVFTWYPKMKWGNKRLIDDEGVYKDNIIDSE